MQALVLEGGSFRAIFSAGVMDALVDNGIDFPYVIGESAGITYGVSYVSKQTKRNYDVLVEFRHDKRYFGLRNFRKEKSIFGLKFAYETIPNEIHVFDREAYQNNPAVVKVCVTDADTGKPVYLDGKELDSKCTMLKATCALPLLFPVVEIGDGRYYDGGISDPIPAKKAIEDGNDKLLIVMTRPYGYRKKLLRSAKLIKRVLGRKYPEFVKTVMRRHEIYNEQVEYCEQLEKEGKAIILRPSSDAQIESLEKDIDRIKNLYNYGYQLAVDNLDRIKALFE